MKSPTLSPDFGSRTSGPPPVLSFTVSLPLTLVPVPPPELHAATSTVTEATTARPLAKDPNLARLRPSRFSAGVSRPAFTCFLLVRERIALFACCRSAAPRRAGWALIDLQHDPIRLVRYYESPYSISST